MVSDDCFERLDKEFVRETEDGDVVGDRRGVRGEGYGGGDEVFKNVLEGGNGGVGLGERGAPLGGEKGAEVEGASGEDSRREREMTRRD